MVNKSAILVLIGATIALIAVFLDWVTLTIPMFAISETATGWDLVESAGRDERPLQYLPAGIIALAAAAIVLAVLELVDKGNKFTRIATMIFGVLIFVFVVLVFNDVTAETREIFGDLLDTDLVSLTFGTGYLLAFYSAIIVIIGSILEMRAARKRQ